MCIRDSHVGVQVHDAVASLASFKSVKRRLEKIYDNNNVRIFDDFAHHPTAIHGTVQALRNNVGDETVIAVLEPRSNTMKQGVHKHLLAESLAQANHVMVYADDNVKWDINELESSNIKAFPSTEKLLNALEKKIESIDGKSNVLIMLSLIHI